jgi:hypothetical protein
LHSAGWVSVNARRVGLLVLLAGLAHACAAPTAGPAPTREPQQLRILNAGNVDIQDLTVLFPGPTADALARRVVFGDVSAGEMTEYSSVPDGVYRYAAYEYSVAGHPAIQAVVDWVGEAPLVGAKFTYRIALDPNKPIGDQVELIEVLIDTP